MTPMFKKVAASKALLAFIAPFAIGAAHAAEPTAPEPEETPAPEAPAPAPAPAPEPDETPAPEA